MALAADDGATFELTEAFDGTAAAAVVTIIGDGVPHFHVETVADGQAAWTYDIFFTGPHLANVPELAVVDVDEGAGAPFSLLGLASVVLLILSWNTSQDFVLFCVGCVCERS